MMHDLKKVLTGAQLPALPQSAMRLLDLSKDPRNGPAEFAVPVESDPGLASQVLRFVNSSYFGFARKIATVKHAITMVGIRTVKNFALWSAVFSSIPDPKCGLYDLKQAWRDALTRALFARALAKTLRAAEIEEPFSAALLQDVAVPLLARALPQPYLRLLETRATTGRRLSDLERAEFGWTHAEAAGLMCRQWNLPDSFAVMIEHHLDIGRHTADAQRNPGLTAVALSALLPSSVDRQWTECGLFLDFAGQIIPPGGPKVEDLFAEVDSQFAELAPMLRLPEARQTLVSMLSDAMACATACD